MLGSHALHEVLPTQPVYCPPNRGRPTLAFTGGAFLIGFFVHLLISKVWLSTVIWVCLQIIALIAAEFMYRDDYRQSRRRRRRALLQTAEVEAQLITRRASGILDDFSNGLQDMRERLRRAGESLALAENEFGERVYAPFWEAVERAAVELAAFHETSRRLQALPELYARSLRGRVHNFPALETLTLEERSQVPATIAWLQRLVRSGQKDIDFAIIWEHRTTRKVLVEGFRTLGEVLGNLGSLIKWSFDDLTVAVTMASQEMLAEQVSMGGKFDEALELWRIRKR